LFCFLDKPAVAPAAAAAAAAAAKNKSKAKERDHDERIPFWILPTTYLSYAFVFSFGKFRDFMGKIFNPEKFSHLAERDVSSTLPLPLPFFEIYVHADSASSCQFLRATPLWSATLRVSFPGTSTSAFVIAGTGP